MINTIGMGPPGLASPVSTLPRYPLKEDIKSDVGFKKAIDASLAKKPKGDGVPIKESPKQQKMLEFMDSFESEFGVSPARFAGAIADVETNQLDKPASETAKAVIDNLQLDPADEEKAYEMYMQMLMQTQDKPVVVPSLAAGMSQMTQTQNAANGVAPSTMLEAGVMAKIISDQPQVQKSTLPSMMKTEKLGAQPQPVDLKALQDLVGEQPLSSMGTEKAVTESAVPAEIMLAPSALAANEIPIPSDAQVSLEDSQSLKELQAKLENLQKSLDDLSRPANSWQNVPVRFNQQQGLSKYKNLAEEAQSQAMDVSDVALVVPAAAGANEAMNSFSQNENLAQGGSHTAQDQMQKNMVDAESVKSGEFKLASFSENGASSPSKSLGVKSTKNTKTNEESSSLSSKMEPTLSGSLDMGNTETFELGAAATGGKIIATTKGDDQANTQQILNQAKTMINRGGGEVKMKLNPEGLGEVMLKVSLEKGKVNMHMSANTEEAKKALEGSLGDLKNSLANQHIQLDNIKVDVARGPSTESQMQRDFQQQGEFGRENSRQFLREFRDDNLAQRQNNMFDWNPRSTPQSKARTLEPSETNSNRVRSYGTKKGSGLNLVA